MLKLAWIAAFATLTVAPAHAQQATFPDLRGTWTGKSESVVLGRGNPHHRGKERGKALAEPRFDSVDFSMTIDKQDGRRFSGTFSSARGKETIIAVIARNGSMIYLVDDDGISLGTILGPNQMELCYMMQTPATRIASCAELTRKQ
jgi:hypothetical protein